jgi:hypothetical protein
MPSSDKVQQLFMPVITKRPSSIGIGHQPYLSNARAFVTSSQIVSFEQ